MQEAKIKYAFTMPQPFASLIVHCVKNWSTMSSCAPTDMIGRSILIYAPRTQNYNVDDILPDGLFFKGRDGWRQDDLPRGAIVGSAKLNRSLEIVNRVGFDKTAGMHVYAVRTMFHRYLQIRIPDHEKKLGEWRPGNWVWEFKDKRLAYKPIPCVGGWDFWRADDMAKKMDI